MNDELNLLETAITKLDQHDDRAGDGLWFVELVKAAGATISHGNLERVLNWDKWRERASVFPSVESDIETHVLVFRFTRHSCQTRASRYQPTTTLPPLRRVAVKRL